ncbi:MAG: hypothetical protein ACRD2D_03465 [Terriglobales bacterium]
MGKLVNFRAPTRRVGEKRRREQDDFVRGQQILANAIFHWKNDKAGDARAAVRFLMHHLATAFRADDAPLQPRPLADRSANDPAP